MRGEEKYADIIALPYHKSVRHPQMSLHDRAAQFAPFSALTGLEDAVEETARVTQTRRELGEEQKQFLDEQLQKIMADVEQGPEVTIEYFKQDERKEGGRYASYRGRVRQVSYYQKQICFMDGFCIKIADIADIRFEQDREGS